VTLRHVLHHRKGQLKPISVVTKMRQGRKASTLITNFESFFLSADALAEELRKTCASATSGEYLLVSLGYPCDETILPITPSVSPVSGKGPNAGLEVLVQGKQIKAVVELLVSKGVPKKWIEAVDVVDKK
jgi:translation initiation factor 2D